MFAQQNKLKELFPKYGWELIETQNPDYFWIAEIWLLKSSWSPSDCNVFIEFEVDQMTEARTEKWKHVWAVNMSLKQPYYWQSSDEINDGQDPIVLQSIIRPHFEKYIPEIFESLNDLRLKSETSSEANVAQEQNREIWGKIKGAEKLFEIYNYFPTLYDAKIRKAELNFDNKEIRLTIDYSDLIEVFEKSIKTRFTICWRNVQKSEFDCYSEDIYGLEFTQEKDFIKTKFDENPVRFSGEIVADEIEIINIETVAEDITSNDAVRFEIS